MIMLGTEEAGHKTKW